METYEVNSYYVLLWSFYFSLYVCMNIEIFSYYPFIFIFRDLGGTFTKGKTLGKANIKLMRNWHYSEWRRWSEQNRPSPCSREAKSPVGLPLQTDNEQESGEDTVHQMVICANEKHNLEYSDCSKLCGNTTKIFKAFFTAGKFDQP